MISYTLENVFIFTVFQLLVSGLILCASGAVLYLQEDPNVVSYSKTGKLDYQSLGASQGQCSLSCDGSDHDAKRYPVPKLPPLPPSPLPMPPATL